MKNKLALGSGFFLVGLGVLAIFGPLLSPYSFSSQDLNHVLNGPNPRFWFGTDELGRDLLTRVLFGARVSLGMGFVAGLISLFMGCCYGAVSGYWGGWIDSVMMRIMDVIQSIPHLVTMILISVLFNAIKYFETWGIWRDLAGMILSLTLLGWVGAARIVRAQVLKIKQNLFVEAARASGAGNLRIIVSHILPQLGGTLVVVFTYLVPSKILLESVLSFIGLGLQPPYSSWGVLANEGWRSFRTYPHLILFPGFAIFLTMMASQFFGDGLRDVFNPQLKVDSTSS